MRIVHMGDIHLGYKAYSRLASTGLNAREADVLRAFRWALERTAALNPDIVIIAGDLFHTVRPSNMVINHTFRQFQAFRAACPAPLVIIGGNHDTPKSTDSGCILDLFTLIPDTYVVYRAYEALSFEHLGATVYCMPYFAFTDKGRYTLKPSSKETVNILAFHGAIEDVMRHTHDPVTVRAGELNMADWDYVALGHYHVFTPIENNCYYSGSVEYTSSNIWEESHLGAKGFILFDTQARQHEFHPTQNLRPVYDLPAIDAKKMNSGDLLLALEDTLKVIRQPREKVVVRVVVEAFPRQLQKDLDWQYIRRIKADYLHFELAFRPDPESSAAVWQAGASGQSRPLEVEWEEFALSLGPGDFPKGVTAQSLLETGRELLARTAEEEAVL